MEYVIYFVIPSLFLFLGAISKRIIRASVSRWDDWFLGVELILTALSTGMMHALDLGFKLKRHGKIRNDLDFLNVTLFIIITFVLFLFIVIVHQRWESIPSTALALRAKSKRERGKIFWLAGVSNTIGYMLFTTYIFLIKGLVD
jgi:hypothetical protein